MHYINGLMLNRGGDEEKAAEAFGNAVQRGYSATLLAKDPNISNLQRGAYLEQITGGST